MPKSHHYFFFLNNNWGSPNLGHVSTEIKVSHALISFTVKGQSIYYTYFVSYKSITHRDEIM